MPSYEPEVIERFAAQLERRARAVRRGFTGGGLVLGAVFGSIPLTPLGIAWPIPHVFGFTTLLVGGCVGALIGWVVGEGRAEMYRLHAQTTLCQLHAQRTSLAIWRLLQDKSPTASVVTAAEPEFDFEAAEPETSSRPQPQPEPQTEPQPQPEPVLAPVARLATAPTPYEADAPALTPLLPDPLPAQVFEPSVPVSAPEPAPPEPVQADVQAPPAAVPVSAQASVPFLRPAGPSQPPVSPPPVSG